MTEHKRTAGELGLAPSNCACDPMDLAALGHMTNCPAYVAVETKPTLYEKLAKREHHYRNAVEGEFHANTLQQARITIEACALFFKIAMPKMNIGASCLDADAIRAWNEAAIAIEKAERP